MMNVIAISLMLASMAFAGVWSPAPQEEQVITKGGHRAVIVEYADDNAGGHANTKVSISPPLTSLSLEEQLSSATAAVAGVAQDAKKAVMGQDEAHGWGPGDLICDAFGKCKHKITGAIYKAKNKVTETTHEVEEGAKGTVDSAIDKAKDLSSKATNAAEHGTDKVKRGFSRAKEAAEDTAEGLIHKGRATVEEAAGEAKRGVSRAKEAAEDTAEELIHRGKATAEEAKRRVSRARESVQDTTEELKNKGKAEMSDIARRAKEVLYDVVSFLVPKEFLKSLMGLVHLLGFATAYGTATWVTFAMSHLLARSLPRQQFGVVQSRVYPVYFKALASSVGLALLGQLLGRRGRTDVAWRLQVYNLLGSIALVLVNLLYLEPRATKVIYERMKIEKEEGRGVSFQATRLDDHTGTPAEHMTTPLDSGTTTTTTATATTTTHRREDVGVGEAKAKMERLNKRLRKLNSYSSLLNVMTLFGLTWHLVYLSQRLCL